MRRPGSGVNLLGVATVAGAIALWEAAVRSGWVRFEFLPAPSGVVGALGHLAATGQLWSTLAHTAQVAATGWLGGAAAGIVAGVVLGLSDRAWRWSMATVDVLRAVPPVCLVPVALLTFGFSTATELVLVVYAGTWPVLLNTLAGVRDVRPQLHDVARTLRLGRATTVRKVVLPAAVPATMVGLRLGLSSALVVAVVAEMVANPSGLGHELVLAQQALRPAEMFAYLAATGLLGVVFNASLRRVATAAVPWHDAAGRGT